MTNKIIIRDFKPPRVQFAHGEAPSHLTFLLRHVSQAVVIFTRLFSWDSDSSTIMSSKINKLIFLVKKVFRLMDLFLVRLKKVNFHFGNFYNIMGGDKENSFLGNKK